MKSISKIEIIKQNWREGYLTTKEAQDKASTLHNNCFNLKEMIKVKEFLSLFRNQPFCGIKV